MDTVAGEQQGSWESIAAPRRGRDGAEQQGGAVGRRGEVESHEPTRETKMAPRGRLTSSNRPDPTPAPIVRIPMDPGEIGSART